MIFRKNCSSLEMVSPHKPLVMRTVMNRKDLSMSLNIVHFRSVNLSE